MTERKLENGNKSSSLFITEALCAAVITNLVNGILLSGYLNYIGISPKMNGIISAIPVLATVFQPLGAVLGRRGAACKRFVVGFALLQRLLFAGFYCLPLMLGVDARASAAVLVFGCANALSALITPSATNWLMALTPENKRQEFFSRREIILVATGALMNLIMGFTMQHFVNTASPEKGYVILSVVILAFTAVNVASLIWVQAPPELCTNKKEKALETLLQPLQSKQFRLVIVVICLYSFATQCAGPFWNIHSLNNLKLSYSYLTVLGVIGSVGKVISLKLWRRFGTKQSWSQVCMFAFTVIGISHLLNALAWEGMAVWYMPIPAFTGLAGWTLVGMGTLNFQYDNAGENGAAATGIVAVASGIVGFIGTIIGGAIMDFATAHGFMLGMQMVQGQQIQMVLSCVILLCTAGWLRLLVQKKRVR